MSISLRFFLFAPDGLYRISQRLLSGLTDGQDAMPQYAGKKLQLAQVVVHLANGKPSQIAKIYGSYLHFDKAGKVDETFARSANEALDTFEAIDRFERTKAAKVVSLTPKLNFHRYEREHRWKPSKQDIELISDALFRRSGKEPRLF